MNVLLLLLLLLVMHIACQVLFLVVTDTTKELLSESDVNLTKILLKH